MRTSREKDLECSCDHKVFIKNDDSLIFLKNLDPDYRYEVYQNDSFKYYAEYIPSENRWFLFTRAVTFDEDDTILIGVPDA